MNLFQIGDFTLSSGKKSNFKIECDALTNDDWECLAFLASQKFEFSEVVGIPRGGLNFARSLEKYIKPNTNKRLIVDDVATTGNTMLKHKEDGDIFLVAFARKNTYWWINAIFRLDI